MFVSFLGGIVVIKFGFVGEMRGDAPKETFREKFPLDSFKSFWVRGMVRVYISLSP